MMDHGDALSGVRVLELGDDAGAYCGKLLADMGADVITIEPPGGVGMRRTGPWFARVPHPQRSLFFWHYNTNKRSITLDLTQAADRAAFTRLARTADVVIETFRPGHLDELGLGYADLARLNPFLILVSITAFGQSGPYRNFRGSDLIAQALGGMAFVNGFADQAPLQGLGLQAYHSAGAYAAIGTLLALLAREACGRGQWVDISLQECIAASVEHASSFFHQSGTIAARQGSLHWTRYFRVVRCADGYAMHCTLGDWTSLLEWVKADGKAQDLTDPIWEDFNQRRDQCLHLFDVLDAWARTYTVADLVEGAQLRRLPYAAVLGPETLADNPQLRERDFFVPVTHDELGMTLLYPGAPYVFSKTPWRIRRRPPLPGEHNGEILGASERDTQTPAPRQHDEPSQAARQKCLPLAGVRIVDFTWVVAGPVATRILADHGADVIKVERRDALDFGSRRGGLTGNLNRGKQSIVINMGSSEGIQLAQRLIATADVVIDNFSARVMRNWGLDYDNLRRIKPDIIALSMSGFGHSGPHRDYVSYGPTLQALSGYTLLMRHRGGGPAGWGFSYSDMAGGYSGALAVLFALWHRRRTGQGQWIDLSQFENVSTLLGPILLDVLINGATVTPVGNRSQEALAAPHGIYRCADQPAGNPPRDRWCAIAVFRDDEWERFRHALGDPAWAQDERFNTLAARLRHSEVLDAAIERWTWHHSAETVMTILQAAGVAAAVVSNAEDLCRRDPHLQARQYWVRMPTPEGDVVELDGIPCRLSETPGRVRAAGPLLGEHTDTVLHEILGLSTTEIAALRAANVIE